MSVHGRVSEFGGPTDYGVGRHEGLALVERDDLRKPLFKSLFLSKQPRGTTGLARRLNPDAHYVAMRWDYKQFPKESLKYKQVLVRANGKSVMAKPVDWGPHPGTGMVADLSRGVMRALGIKSGQRATLVLIN